MITLFSSPKQHLRKDMQHIVLRFDFLSWKILIMLFKIFFEFFLCLILFDYRLTAWRSGMTVLANVLVYLVAWAILNRSSNDMICPDDAYAFRNLMLVCISIGAAASIGYHLSVKFPNAPGNIKVLINV